MSTHGVNQYASAGYAPMVSGEAVQIDLRVARIGSRAVAGFLDLLIELFALGFINGLLLNLLSLDTAALQAVAITVAVLVLIGYPVIMEAAWGGRTLGKAAMGLRAARDDGGPLRFRHALVRGLLGFFVEKPGISLGLVAIICSLLSARGKRLGDLLAGTVVLQVRLPASGAYVPPMPPPLAGWATALDLSRLNDVLALQCRQFLGRAGQLSGDARERLGGSLVASVQAAVAPLPPPGTPGWAYLSAVLAERRRREELRLYGNSYPVQQGQPGQQGQSGQGSWPNHPGYAGSPSPATPSGWSASSGPPPAPAGNGSAPGPFAPPT